MFEVFNLEKRWFCLTLLYQADLSHNSVSIHADLSESIFRYLLLVPIVPAKQNVFHAPDLHFISFLHLRIF
jgi:hypothetical protein